MRVAIKSDEQIVLRDGRPFGDVGAFGGNSLNWPQPQTIAGMLRTKIGFSRSEDYFDKDKDESIQEILKIGLNRIMPYVILEDGSCENLAPIPADMIFTGKENSLTSNILEYELLDENSGTDLPNREWLIPKLTTKDKPSKDKPFFLYWNVFEKYLQGEEISPSKLIDIGINQPVTQERIHNGLCSDTLTTEEGRLFMNRGIYLRTKLKIKSNNEDKWIIDNLGIGLNIIGNQEKDEVLGDGYLGGERHRIYLEKCGIEYPKCPQIFQNQEFLKLILVTHGDFGGWCPTWLKPNLEAQTIDWVTIPNTDFQVRLRSASLAGWDGISGWDYVKNKPKPMKKLLRPGSVFIIEIRDPSSSQNIADKLWGSSINQDSPQSVRDGYGQIIVGNIKNLTKKEINK